MNIMVLLIAAILGFLLVGGVVLVLVLLLTRRNKPAPAGIRCAGCGMSLRPDWKLCPHCGKTRDDQ